MGCLCYISILPKGDKFAPRASACVFLGYSNSQKGYKVQDLLTNKIFISRDVVFHETMFPCSHLPQNQPIFPVPPIELPADPLPIFPQPQDTLDTCVPRRSTRIPRPPIWSQDYVCSSSSSPYPISTYLAYDKVYVPYKSFLSNLSTHREPTSYHEAVVDPRWLSAMELELQALSSNNTWEIVDLPPGKVPIGNKWDYKIKYHPDGSVDRYKARLVAKGYTQLYGVDFHDTFSPVAKITTVRCLLSVAAMSQWPLYQMDVTNVFLQGDLDEEIYMILPPGLRSQGESCEGLRRQGEFEKIKVCKLMKSLYGLKQASRQWNIKFASIMKAAGFYQSKHDHSMSVKKKQEAVTILLVYVDDIVITGNHPDSIDALKVHLHL